MSSHAEMDQEPTLKPLQYDSGAGSLTEGTDNYINFDENKVGTHTSSSCQI